MVYYKTDWKKLGLDEETKEFLGYCYTHSKTERHLFSGQDANRLNVLMGAENDPNAGGYIPIDQYRMNSVLEDIIKYQSSQNKK